MSYGVLSHFLAAGHRELDRLMEDADNACGTPRGAAAFARFREVMEHHLEIEERVLFPEFARRAGPGGPLAVMRQEHDAIRGLLASGQGDPGAVSHALFDTLTVLVSQHHVKEENVLYPMSDTLLADCAEALLAAMQEAPAVHG
ncbi:hemerythrin domain-containing protein [Acidiferrobacter sp.]|uniref:hemerythrin domain-containing protein n=1 Tax=Acidiferrobacter sp. TaxID=1872107 RepID=UPI002629503E|nr:hemerythrin domain-containing protein [Acidiferrobacter sp.]